MDSEYVCLTLSWLVCDREKLWLIMTLYFCSILYFFMLWTLIIIDLFKTKKNKYFKNWFTDDCVYVTDCVCTCDCVCAFDQVFVSYTIMWTGKSKPKYLLCVKQNVVCSKPECLLCSKPSVKECNCIFTKPWAAHKKFDYHILGFVNRFQNQNTYFPAEQGHSMQNYIFLTGVVATSIDQMLIYMFLFTPVV